jgi:HEAT repeat protein
MVVLSAASVAAEPGPDRLVQDLGSPSGPVREEAKASLRTAGEDALPALLRGLDSTNVVRRALCVELMGAGGLAGGREGVRAVLDDEESPDLLRRACCRALGRIGDYRDVAALSGLVDRYPEAAEALAELEAETALPALRTAVRDAPSPQLFYALAALGEDSGYERLIGALSEDGRREALAYLRRLSGKDPGPTREAWEGWWRRERLARRLGDADWGESERALAEVVGRARSAGALSGEMSEDLMAIAEDTSAPRFARCKAVLVLGLVKERRALELLLEMLNGDEDGLVREYAAEAVGRMEVAETAVDLCTYLIFDEEPFRKWSAKDSPEPQYYTIDSEVCKALLRLGVTGGLDYMIRQLQQEHRVRVYHEAVRVLRKVTGRSLGFLPDGAKADRRSAARRWREWFDENRGGILPDGAAARGDRRLRERVRALVDRLDHFHFLTMSRARETLVLLGEVALPELLAGLRRPEPHVRGHCTEILGRIRCKAARPALSALVNDERPEVRTKAVAALGQIGPGDQSAAVLAALEDEELDVRIAAVSALSRVSRELAVPAVMAALRLPENRSETFRREAYYALAIHGEVVAVEWLAGMLSHPDRAFRQLVADRLEVLTGRNPGVAETETEAWRRWWRGVSSGRQVR